MMEAQTQKYHEKQTQKTFNHIFKEGILYIKIKFYICTKIVFLSSLPKNHPISLKNLLPCTTPHIHRVSDMHKLQTRILSAARKHYPDKSGFRKRCFSLFKIIAG
jgi:hypothetical protein